jgi:GTP-binding protein YchF
VPKGLRRQCAERLAELGLGVRVGPLPLGSGRPLGLAQRRDAREVGLHALAAQQPAEPAAGEDCHQREESARHVHAFDADTAGRQFRRGAPSPALRKLPSVALTIGIVGLPNVGKSTLFNALTRNDVPAANYPFATIDPNIGVVGVPDARLDVLAKMFNSAKIVPATVSFVDIAGIVKGASEGAGLGNQFLANIREADAICQVIRAFADPDVVHIDGKISPKDDIETINTELILADLQTIEKALPRLQKEARTDRERQPVLAAAEEAQRVLSTGQTAFGAGLQRGPLRELQLMTAKPFLYVFNVDPDEMTNPAFTAEMRQVVAPAEAIFLDAKTEADLMELEPAEALELLQSMGQEESGLDILARVGFATLGLQTYLTAGPKESRAWTIRRGATAPEAAGIIHSDFQHGFIKAEVVSFSDLEAAGSMLEARARGKVRIEGKDYVMQDDDVVEFRHGSTSSGKK